MIYNAKTCYLAQSIAKDTFLMGASKIRSHVHIFFLMNIKRWLLNFSYSHGLGSLFFEKWPTETSALMASNTLITSILVTKALALRLGGATKMTDGNLQIQPISRRIPRSPSTTIPHTFNRFSLWLRIRMCEGYFLIPAVILCKVFSATMFTYLATFYVFSFDP